MIPKSFSIVGPGKVGTSVAHWLVALGSTLQQVAARRPESAEKLSSELGGAPVRLADLDSDRNGLLVISTSDAALPEVASLLAQRRQAPVALHVAGAVGADSIAPLRSAGSEIGTLHPLRAFPRPSRDLAEAAGTVFAVDGDPGAVSMAETLASALGGEAVQVEAEHRILYHLAASIAAGGVVTLLAAARSIADSLGLDPTVQRGYFELARQALQQAEAAPHPAEAITGPVSRGNAKLVERQLHDLNERLPELVELVALLDAETIRQYEAVAELGPGHDRIRSILAKARQRKSFLDPK